MTLHLIFNTWLQADRDLLALADAVGTFVAGHTGWSDPIGDGSGRRTYRATHSPDGRRHAVARTREEALAQIRERMALGRVSALDLEASAGWQNPYVLHQELYDNWGVVLLLYQTTAELSLHPLEFHFHEASFWFPTQKNAEIFFDKDHTVRENRNLGYELKEAAVQPSWVPAAYGKMYVAEQAISRQNRLRLIRGIARFIHAFAPPAGALHFGGTTRYDPAKGLLSLPPPEKRLLYYTAPGVHPRPEAPQHFIERELEGVRLQLEEEHFSFL